MTSFLIAASSWNEADCSTVLYKVAVKTKATNPGPCQCSPCCQCKLHTNVLHCAVSVSYMVHLAVNISYIVYCVVNIS